jgi:hypothetical protein
MGYGVESVVSGGMAVKLVVEKVLDGCYFDDHNEIFVEWLLGHLWRNAYKFEVDNERSDGLDVYVVRPIKPRKRFDMFEFFAEEADFIVEAVRYIGAYVLINVCNDREDECINVYWQDLKRLISDELPIVGL